jgi:hypothetical protein
VNETTIPEEKGKRKKKDRIVFFGAVVCVRASEDERKRERKRDFPLLFKRFIKGALRAEFSLSLSLSPSRSFVFVTLQASIHFCATHKHAPKRKQNAFFCFFREGGEVIEKKKSKKKKKKKKNKNNKR